MGSRPGAERFRAPRYSLRFVCAKAGRAMGILGVILLLAAFPVILVLLKSPRSRRWAFFALGALPVLQVPMNLEASLISWPTWAGHSRGLALTMLDSLALAICVRYARGRRVPPLLWVFAVYFVCMLPGLFVGMFTPALFTTFQILRVALFFYAAYLVVLNGQLARIAEGLAVAVIVSGVISAYQSLSGQVQAPGLFGHQNLTGLVTNLCVGPLLALGLRTRRLLFLLAVAAAGIGAVAGGSRAAMVFFAFLVSASVVAAVLIKPTGRSMAIAGLAALGLVAATPFAFQKFNERGVEGFTVDEERIAFERAAELMADDHPWGVGLNQFVNVANASGYYARAGVRWGANARSTNVHNSYWLVRAEAGLIGLFGLLIWMFVPVVSALRVMFRKRLPLREAGVASAIAVTSAALHSQYEWILITATPQYLISLMAGIIAAASVYSVPTKKGALAASPGPNAEHDRTESRGLPAKPAGL